MNTSANPKRDADTTGNMIIPCNTDPEILNDDD